jgi:hypothetical protein
VNIYFFFYVGWVPDPTSHFPPDSSICSPWPDPIRTGDFIRNPDARVTKRKLRKVVYLVDRIWWSLEEGKSASDWRKTTCAPLTVASAVA